MEILHTVLFRLFEVYFAMAVPEEMTLKTLAGQFVPVCRTIPAVTAELTKSRTRPYRTMSTVRSRWYEDLSC